MSKTKTIKAKKTNKICKKHEWIFTDPTTRKAVKCVKCGKQFSDLRLIKSQEELIEDIEYEKRNVRQQVEETDKMREELQTEKALNNRLLKYIAQTPYYAR